MEDSLYSFAQKIYPICRSLSGEGVRKTLKLIQQRLPHLEIHQVATGTKCFDWDVPDEWNIADAFIADSSGKRIVDFQANNLHIVGYSEPVDCELSLEELQKHLFSLPEQPNAIPYVTSYYRKMWGFCLTQKQRDALQPGKYKVSIDATLKPGHLNYGELVIPGKSKKEILFSTYVCHPSMGNNETSGPVVATFLADYISKIPNREFTYRFVFVPETIGSVIYLSKNASAMKENTVAGFVLTCVGDNLAYSFMPSRLGHTLADKVALHVLRHEVAEFKEYSFLQRGSDERQYCSPRVDLPVVSIMRSKYAEYAEYHTSLDDIHFISQQGLEGAFNIYKSCIELLESNKKYQVSVMCEPQLGKRGLYPTVSSKGSAAEVRRMMNFIAYCDGNSDLIDIAERINVYAKDLLPIAKTLLEKDLLQINSL